MAYGNTTALAQKVEMRGRRNLARLQVDADFPSVLEYEVPAFLADKASVRNGTSEAYFTPTLSSADSVYVMWIGTNDLGVYAFLTESQVPGKVLTDYTDCVYQSLDQLYAAGARVFVLFNTVSLQLAPLYANTSINGVTETHYWPMMPSNKTQIAETMHEYTTTVNNVYKYQSPFEALVSQRYPGASFANFDVWSLVSDIYNNPSTYLNGTEAPNVSGFEHHCSGEGDTEVCTDEYNGTSPDSFLPVCKRAHTEVIPIFHDRARFRFTSLLRENGEDHSGRHASFDMNHFLEAVS